MHPTWFGYAMRENAPFKDSIDKWYYVLFTIAYVKCVVSKVKYYRVRRMSQFGLYLHWHELAKIAHSEYKIAQKNIGNLASYQVMKMLLLINQPKKCLL